MSLTSAETYKHSYWQLQGGICELQALMADICCNLPVYCALWHAFDQLQLSILKNPVKDIMAS